MADVKRSMAVHPAPLVIENGKPRLPRNNEQKFSNSTGDWEPWTGVWGYRITRVTNSVEYRPGFLLLKPQIQSLIDGGWTVSVLSK